MDSKNECNEVRLIIEVKLPTLLISIKQKMRVFGRNCLAEPIPPMGSEFVAQVHHHPLQGVEHLRVSVLELRLLGCQGADVLVLMLGILGFAEDGDDPAESVS